MLLSKRNKHQQIPPHMCPFPDKRVAMHSIYGGDIRINSFQNTPDKGSHENHRKQPGKARSRDRASLVVKLTDKTVRLSPELSKIVPIVPSQKVLADLICNIEFKAISAESRTANEPSAVLAILHKLLQVRGPHDAFTEAIETAQDAHANPLLIAISKQAATDADLFSIWRDDAVAGKDRRIVSYFVQLFETNRTYAAAAIS